MSKQRKPFVRKESKKLPTANEAEQLATDAAKEVGLKRESTRKVGRPKAKQQREKYTITILPELRKAIKKEAANKDIQQSDVLEYILKQYFDA